MHFGEGEVLVLVATILVAALVLSATGGAWVGRWVAARSKPDPGGAGLLLGAATGLLGLLIGFTFAMSAERFETRRELVVSEANALSTTYLRDSLFPAPYGVHLDALLARYGEARLDFFAAGRDPARLAEVGRKTGVLQDQIWKETAAALKLPGSAPVATAVLVTTNEMFDLAATRQAARQAPVPQAILWLLALVAIGTAGLCGYSLRLGGGVQRIAASTLLVMIGASMALILDLDWPTHGLIIVPQQPMLSEVADLKAHELRRQEFTLPDLPASVGGQ
jgi:hypothetical protein